MARRKALRSYSHIKKKIHQVSRREAGDILVKAYAPGLRMEATMFANISEYYYTPGEQAILWATKEGLQGLMHELGHAVANHTNSKGAYDNYMKEMEAWVWAEREMKKLGLKFNYDFAEQRLKTYQDADNIPRIAKPWWRYK